MFSLGTRFILALSLAASLSFASAAQADDPPQNNPSTTKEWTILVFLNADNNLDSFSVQNMNQMEKVGSSDKVNIVVQLDREGSTGTWRYYIQKDNKPSQITSPKIETLPEQDMGSPDTLRAFLKWGMEKYPAKHYFVDFWNHGAGWEKKGTRYGTKGISYDDQSGNHLSVAQVGQVMREMSQSLGRKVDVVGYDACLMQMAEVAAEVTDSCSYQVASEETIPGAGWPYDEWLAKVVAGPESDGAQVGRWLVDAYKASYSSSGQDTTLSCLDLSKLASLIEKLDGFTQALLADPASKSAAAEAARAAQSYTYSSHKDLYDFVDRVLKKVTTKQVVDAGNALKDCLNSQVVLSNAHTGSGAEGSHGLALWLPTSGGQDMMQRYRGLSWASSTQWDEFLSTLKSSGEAVASALGLIANNDPSMPDFAALASGLTGTADLEGVARAARKNHGSVAVRNLLRAAQAERMEALQ